MACHRTRADLLGIARARFPPSALCEGQKILAISAEIHTVSSLVNYAFSNPFCCHESTFYIHFNNAIFKLDLKRCGFFCYCHSRGYLWNLEANAYSSH